MSVEPEPSSASRLLSAEAPPHWRASLLAGVRHGFFGREGGVSGGIYESLNAGTGSKDDPTAVQENRRRIASAFAAQPDCLIGVHQVHSPHAVFISKPWTDARPEADALVTTTPNLALSILTADCAPVLLADTDAGVIGAAHAGWKGALSGLLEVTVALMRGHGAQHIVAAIGPCIHQASYEVGPEFEAGFLSEDSGYAALFAPGETDRKYFDLPGFCARRLGLCGVETQVLPFDTYAHPEWLHSHRRSVHEQLGDYGRNCSAIAL
jgi:polyphenol oxidase